MSKAGTADPASPPGPSPLHLIRRALRFWRLGLVVFIGVLSLAALLAWRTPRVYRSESVILYRQPPRQGYAESDTSRRVGARLQDMLVARDRLARIVKELRLADGDLDAFIDGMKPKIALRVRDGNTFTISFDGDTPAEAQAVTARLAQTLIEDDGKQRAQAAHQMQRFLEAEKQRFETDVRQREEALASFLHQHPELVLAAPRGSGGSNDATVAAISAELERLRGSGRSVAGAPASPRQGPDPELVQAERRAANELAQAQRDIAERQQRLTEAHPDMIAARDRLRIAEGAALRARAALNAAERPEPAPTAVTATAAPPAPDGQIAALERRLARLRSGPPPERLRPGDRELAQRQVQLQSLRHDVDQARDRLASLEDRQFQATLAAKLEASHDVGQLMVLDPAYRPGLPLVDTKKKLLIAGLGLALLLAAGAALLRALTDDRLFDRTDAEWLAGYPVLAQVPDSERLMKEAARG